MEELIPDGDLCRPIGLKVPGVVLGVLVCLTHVGAIQAKLYSALAPHLLVELGLAGGFSKRWD